MGAAAGLAHEGFAALRHDLRGLRLAPGLRLHPPDHRRGEPRCEDRRGLPEPASGYGPSHQAAEDLALFRAMPNMTVIDPCDALETEQVVPAIAAHRGPVYMRLLRGRVPLVLDEYGYQFELGKAKVIRDGSDVLVISSGLSPCGRSRRRRRSKPTRSRSRCCTCRRSTARHRDDPPRGRPHRPDGRRR